MDQQLSEDFDLNEQNYDGPDEDYSNIRGHGGISSVPNQTTSIYQRNQSIILPQQPPDAPPNFNPQDFLFPPQGFQNIQWSSVDQIKEYLDRGIQKLNLGFTSRLYIQRTQFGHLLFKCKICHCRITFSKPQNYKLIRFENKHNHQYKQIMERNQQQNIYSFLLDIPFQQGIFLNTQIRYMVKNKFDISKDKAKAISDRFLRNYMDLDFILQKIARETQTIFKKFYNQSEKQTSAVLMVTPQMKKRYQRYGKNDCIIIDLKKRILTNVNQNGRIWQLVFIYGQDNDLSVIFFGLCLISDRSPYMYSSILKCFFNLMEDNNLCGNNTNCYPQTVITDQNPGLTEGISLFLQKIPQEQRFTHLLDWRSKLKQIKQHLKKKNFTNDETGMLLNWFGLLLSVPSTQRFSQILNQNRLHKIDEQLVNGLIEKKSQYCLSYFPLKFCGFAPATKRNDYFNQIIRANFKPGKNFAKFFFQFLKYQNSQPIITMDKESKTNVMKQNMYPQLQSIQQKLHSRVFAKLLQNFTATIDMDSVKQSETSYKIVHKTHSQQLQLNENTNIWVCTCHYQQKVGIICMHQLKLIGQYPYLIQKHIHERWLLKGSQVKYQEKDNVKLEGGNQENNISQPSKEYIKREHVEYKDSDLLDFKNLVANKAYKG